ncbi:hypothetical protein Goshw_017976, partial [Gossypium schwendimanii]|nr:hypothetical protein [Gossypium schwendimanii]
MSSNDIGHLVIFEEPLPEIMIFLEEDNCSSGR